MNDTTLLDSLSPDPGKRIEQIVQYYRKLRKPSELFEALKMQKRHALGLPMLPPADEKEGGIQKPEMQRALEDGLLDACRQVGGMSLADGKIAQGWMYLRPTGDYELAKRLCSGIEITDDNYDEMIAVLLHDGVDLRRGYQALLDRQGTCNGITLYDHVITHRNRWDQRIAAGCLIDHVYGELLRNIRQDFCHRGAQHAVAPGQIADNSTTFGLMDYVTHHPWILRSGGYHVDATHLMSVIHHAKILVDPNDLRKAWEMSHYGRHLDASSQYPGEEPFVDFYPAHAAFFGALLGRDVPATLRRFEQKAQTVDASKHGTAALETYVDLLDRLDRPAEALAAAMEGMPADRSTQPVMADWIRMAARAKLGGHVDIVHRLEIFLRNREDGLGLAAVSSI